MAKNNVADLLSVGSLFTTQAERDEAQRETVRDIPLEEISDFPNHPFKVRILRTVPSSTNFKWMRPVLKKSETIL